MEDPTYRIDDSRIISEVLDGETIIIDFKNGSYYSLNASGSVIWEKIQKGYSESQILEYMVGRFDADADTVKKSSASLLTLLEELLLVSKNAAQPAQNIETHTADKQAFLAPALQQFQDMQEMLLADPIHDVDETGWPALKK